MQNEITDEMRNAARKELARRELVRRQKPFVKSSPIEDKQNFIQKMGNFSKNYINDPMKNMLSQADEMSSGYLQGLANIAPGIGNLGVKAKNLVTEEQTPEYKGFDFAPHTANAAAGEIGSFFGPGMLGKIPEIASMAGKIGKTQSIDKLKELIQKSPEFVQKLLNISKPVASNAALGAIMSPEDQSMGALLGGGGAAAGKLMGINNPLAQAIGRSALGGGLGYAVGGERGAETGAGLAAIGPKALKMSGLTGHIPGEELLKGLSYKDVAPAYEAGERLGTHLSPSESLNSGLIGKKEGQFTRTEEAAQFNEKNSKERKMAENKSISNILDTIYDRKVSSDKHIQNLYKKAYSKDVDQNIVIALHEEDPIVKQAFQDVEKKPSWQRGLKNVNANNYEYLDKVIKEISDEEQRLLRTGRKEEAKQYSESRKNMQNILDNANPDYKFARDEAQKRIVRNKMQSKLNGKEINANNFYKTFIQNQNKFEELLKSLKNVPEAQEKLMDVQKAWGNIIHPQGSRTSAYQASTGISDFRGKLQEALAAWQEMTGSKYNKKSVEFIRSDAWMKRLKQIDAEKNEKKKESMKADLFGKLLPGSFESLKNND